MGKHRYGSHNPPPKFTWHVLILPFLFVGTVGAIYLMLLVELPY